LAGFFSSFY